MAKEDEIVILEDDEAIGDDEEIIELELEDDEVVEDEISEAKAQELQVQDQKAKKRVNIFSILAIVVLLLIIVALGIIISKSTKEEKEQSLDPQKITENIRKKEIKAQFTPSKIENMLKRANILYEQGNKIEALSIYEDIAAFNEAISQYNMGVAQMKEGNFKQALVSFKNAILNKEKRTVSAINGAICALRLKDQKLFKYYLDLAYTYLPEESNSPLFSYYAGLISYYKGNYYEALSAFSHPSSKFYKQKQEYLSSKIFSFLDSPYNAIKSIQAQDDMDNTLTLGLLHARIGDYEVAKKLLLSAKKSLIDPQRTELALALVDMKLGNFASTALAYDKYYGLVHEPVPVYPIKATLNKSLFNVNLAQEQFLKEKFLNKKNQYTLLFYFAPYKVFDSEQTISMIRKGGLDVFVDEIHSGLDYLKTSSTIAKINASMSSAIKNALNHHYLQANKEFVALTKTYSKHAILHYNLALTYAQMGNFTKAYKHFRTSYRLDQRNYLSGIFAIMSSQLMGKENSKLMEIVKKDIDGDESLEKVNFYMTLAHFIENNQLSMNRWLEHDKKNTPIHLMFDIITAKLTDNKKIYLKKSSELLKILPEDIIANIMYFNAKNDAKSMKEYAKNIQINLSNKNFNKNAFYYGSSLVKEEYVKMLQLSGLLYSERNRLKHQLQVESADVVGIMQALAYIDLYTGHFEESYVLYNSLIDDHAQEDTNTIFYAAVASIGANHPENAIALLQLSKMIDGNNLESRYALGLLYQEIKNYKGAVIQYRLLGNRNFKSKYFDFEIVR